MKRSAWAQKHYDNVKDDPEYHAAGLMIEINEQICIRMDELGLSQSDLAKRIGHSQPYVSKMLNRGTNMTLRTIAKIALALDLVVEPPRFVSKEEYEAFDADEELYELRKTFAGCSQQSEDQSEEEFLQRNDYKQGVSGDVPVQNAA